MSPTPEKIDASWRLDSRGRPTVQAWLTVGDIEVTALVPSGASTGSKEAVELRDGDENSFLGFGVEKAIRNITDEIAPAISKFDVADQEGIDRAMIELDGTENKSRLGANAILAVSMAVARAGAEVKGVPLFKHLADLHGEKSPTLLPIPMMNVVNGGVHAHNGLDFQEFMIVPIGANSFSKAMRMGMEVYRKLALFTRSSGVGDEGGYSPSYMRSRSARGRVREALNMLMDGNQKAGYKPGEEIAIALDPAASGFYSIHTLDYELRGLFGREIFTSFELIDFYRKLIKKFPIVSIEDGLAEGDTEGWKQLTASLGSKIQLVGDDLFVTNPGIFKEGIQAGIANAVLVKPNQIGTVTETLEVIRMAKDAGYNIVISHRSGETEDTFIADLAVATRAGQIKTGAPARGERTAKYNRLLGIEQYELPRLGLTPDFAGVRPYRR